MSCFVPTNYDLRTALVFCYHLRKTAAESHRMLVEAYGKHALGKTQCFEWFKKFKSGDFDVRNEERGKPPKKFTDKELQALLDKNDTQTQQELAVQLNVTQKAVSIRLKAMGMIQRAGKWVPKLETIESVQIKEEPTDMEYDEEKSKQPPVEAVQIKEEPSAMASEDEELVGNDDEKLTDEELLKFGENIITKMKYVSEVDNIKLMLEIQELVTQTRLKYLQTQEEDRPHFVNVQFD